MTPSHPSQSTQSQQNQLTFVPRARLAAHNGRIKLDLHMPSFLEFLEQHQGNSEWLNLGIKEMSKPTPDGRTHCLFLWDQRYRLPASRSHQSPQSSQ